VLHFEPIRRGDRGLHPHHQIDPSFTSRMDLSLSLMAKGEVDEAI
jgi:hypothetical protein